MAFTRLIQTGFEFRDINELDSYASYGLAGTSSIATGAGFFYTGTASLSLTSGKYPRGKAISGGIVCAQASMFLNYGGVGASDEAIIYLIRTTAFDTVITLDIDDDLVRIRTNGTEVSTAVPGNVGLDTTGTFIHIGLYYYANSSTGRIALYVGGTLAIEFDGDTGSDIIGVYVGGELSTNAWTPTTVVDDFYINVSSSEETESPPPSLRFDIIRPTADGSPIDWSTNGSGTHYLNVDDPTPDDDTTYNYAISSTLVDTYTLGDYSPPSGYSISAVIPTVRAKKTSAGTNPTLDIGLNENSTDAYSSAKTLSTTYEYLFDRQTVAPDTDAWDDTNIDATSLKIRSSGTF